jgi:hypothetical protein
MYISPRAALIRNVSVSLVNGGITLIILLIAPLGIMAVIINTLLVTVATYTVTIAVDRVIMFLQPNRQAELLSRPRRSPLGLRNASMLDRRQ